MEFYDGIPEIFDSLKDEVDRNNKYNKFGIHVEHYIVSTGLTEMIRGSKVATYVKDIWGCEFIETPVPTDLDVKKIEADRTSPPGSPIQQIGYIVDNTSKTRALFEINKGVNIFEYMDVNSRIESIDRRVPFENMIYIADGPSDVPVFSVLKQYGGKTFAIYPHNDRNAFRQVDQLKNDGRIDMYAEANYSAKTTAYMWISTQIETIADRIYAKRDNEVRESASTPPKHITE